MAERLNYAPPPPATPMWIRVARIISLLVVLSSIAFWLLVWIGETYLSGR